MNWEKWKFGLIILTIDFTKCKFYRDIEHVLVQMTLSYPPLLDISHVAMEYEEVLVIPHERVFSQNLENGSTQKL